MNSIKKAPGKTEGNVPTIREIKDTKLTPDFDDSTLKKPETYLNHLSDIINDDDQALHEHKDILKKLLSEIGPLDFAAIIKPEAATLIKEYNSILQANETGNDELYQELNKPKESKEESRVIEIQLKLNTIRKGLRQKHYVVCIISELLKIAAKSNWNLCQRYDYVYIYNGAYWKQLSKDDLKYFLGEVAVKFGFPEIDAKHHLFKDELLKQFVAEAHLPVPEHDPTRILINLKNGTFEFKGGKWKLKAFDPKDFLIYQLPFSYDPGAECNLFDSYLKKVLPDDESRLILQEFAGFIFTKLNLEKCLILTGGGSNGKSVFFNILTALVGVENTLSYSMGLFNHEYNRAKLTNILLNYSSEKGTDLNVETFKALISGEPLQAREPYGKSFTINNNVKFIMNCNELPKETESTEAYFRRYIIIPFDVKISEAERDINLAENIISNELAGVFNWLLVGLERLVNNKKFTESEKVNDALDDFKRQSDNVALFIDEFEYNPTENKKALAELFVQYRSFCVENGYKSFGKNNFSIRLESKGFEPTRLNDGSKGFYLGN